MSKKTKAPENLKSFSMIELQSKLFSINPEAKLVHESPFSNISDYLGLGNYLLNCQISGSMFKGLPFGRVSILAGEPGCIHPKQKVRVYISKLIDKKDVIEE